MWQRIHELKVATQYFDPLRSGEKCFDVRRDDRGFQRGDVLILRRWGGGTRLTYLSGDRAVRKNFADTVWRRVTWILTGGQFGIEPGYVVLGLEPCEALTSED